MITAIWNHPSTVTENNFIHKSLSNWALNLAVGCNHGCRFCYVPEVSTRKMAEPLSARGVMDPDAEWGDYVFVRPFNPSRFKASLRAAENTPREKLKPDGNRAVMLCSTTDAYQVLKNPLGEDLRAHRRAALNLLETESTLNVRILTRSPLAQEDFGHMRTFNNRLLFGMSLPTLRNDLATIYEPKAPAPTQRLKTLQAAKAWGIPLYVAVAPTYPECDQEDMANTLREVLKLDPVTIFMEPINIRADNVRRIEAHAQKLGKTVNTAVFTNTSTQAAYAMKQLRDFESLAHDFNISHKILHLWPDATLKSHFPQDINWLNHHWNKISQWPK